MTQYPTDAHHFCFTSIIEQTIPRIRPKVFDLEKSHMKFWRKKKCQKTVFSRIPPGDEYDQEVQLSIFVVIGWAILNYQKGNFVFIGSTAMAMGQGHRKVNWYIFPDLYFLCPKYLSFSWFSSNDFEQKLWRRTRNELET